MIFVKAVLVSKYVISEITEDIYLLNYMRNKAAFTLNYVSSNIYLCIKIRS